MTICLLQLRLKAYGTRLKAVFLTAVCKNFIDVHGKESIEFLPESDDLSKGGIIMEKILFINACVRKNSRTLELTRCILDKLSGEICEINLEQENLKPLDGNVLEKRERLVSENDFSDEMFRYAKKFADADTIVIAAPYWDLAFPALLLAAFALLNACSSLVAAAMADFAAFVSLVAAALALFPAAVALALAVLALFAAAVLDAAAFVSLVLAFSALVADALLDAEAAFSLAFAALALADAAFLDASACAAASCVLVIFVSASS